MAHDRTNRDRADRPGAGGLSSVGLGTAWTANPSNRPAVDLDRQRAEARFAVSTLAGTLGGVYCLAGITTLGRPSIAAPLIAVGLLQVVWVASAQHHDRPALLIGLALNASLAGGWLLSITAGPTGIAGQHPIGLLDAVCALDSAVIVMFTGALNVALAARGVPHRQIAPMSHAAVLLAVLTASALLAGHSHTARAAIRSGAHPTLHLYCTLV